MLRGKLILVVLSLFLSVSCLFGEAVRKEKMMKDGSKEFVYLTGSENRESVVESYDKNYFLRNVSGRVPDGEAKEYYENGMIKAVEKFKEGQRYDVVKYYHNSSCLKAEIPYIKGKREGRAKIYFEDGTLRMEASFKKDVMEGAWKEYWLDGSLKTDGNIDTTLKTEVVKGYSWEGHQTYEFKLNKGKYEGALKEFNKDGSLKGGGGIINNELYLGGENLYRRFIYDAGLRRFTKDSWPNKAVKSEYFFNMNGFMEDMESFYLQDSKPSRLRQYVSNKIVIEKQYFGPGIVVMLRKIRPDGTSLDVNYDQKGNILRGKKK